MIRLALTLLSMAATNLSAPLRRGDEPERGSVSLEQVMTTLGLFLLALGVVAGITAAVNGRLAQIT